jgi:hypothetical protein
MFRLKIENKYKIRIGKSVLSSSDFFMLYLNLEYLPYIPKK